MSEALLASAGAIVALMLVTWLLSLVLKDASIVDIIWGFGFVVVAWTVFAVLDDPGPRSLLLVILTTLWGLRLTGYLAWRNIGNGEDYRYVAMREKHGWRFPLVSLFVVFGLQGVLMWIVSLPVQAGQHGARPIGWLDAIGVAAWGIGVFFETVGDFQLARFKADPANQGKVMDRGLWRYTRHPNYFGDFMVWWGIYLVAVAGGAWWTVVGPIVMTALLMRYSGAGLLEKTITRRRPEYEDYIRRTSGFLPLPPRRS